MTNWIYGQTTIRNDEVRAGSAPEALNEQGSKGWELVSSASVGDSVAFFFRKPKPRRRGPAVLETTLTGRSRRRDMA